MQSRFPVSEEQWPAVPAPLEPTVVIAGAGSGKTTLMAARVVFLVATGQVRADEVLGLTFTTKAAGELAADVRTALSGPGCCPTSPPTTTSGSSPPSRPTTRTPRRCSPSRACGSGTSPTPV